MKEVQEGTRSDIPGRGDSKCKHLKRGKAWGFGKGGTIRALIWLDGRIQAGVGLGGDEEWGRLAGVRFSRVT